MGRPKAKKTIKIWYIIYIYIYVYMNIHPYDKKATISKFSFPLSLFPFFVLLQ